MQIQCSNMRAGQSQIQNTFSPQTVFTPFSVTGSGLLRSTAEMLIFNNNNVINNNNFITNVNLINNINLIEIMLTLL